jgi:hypothetical protein
MPVPVSKTHSSCIIKERVKHLQFFNGLFFTSFACWHLIADTGVYKILFPSLIDQLKCHDKKLFKSCFQKPYPQ